MLNPAYTLPVWLTDDQLLRDEAVLFGLSEARPDEKIAAIRLAFAALTAPLEKQVEQHQEAIGNLNLLLTDAEAVQPNPFSAYSQRRLGGWPVGICLLGLLASIALCVGTYVGTAALTNAQLALLAATLVGLSSCAATLFTCQAVYRSVSASSRSAQNRDEEIWKQQVAGKLLYQQQKREEISQLYKAEAALNQQYAHRDQLIRLFESEFDLARSLRHQLRDRFVDL